MLLQWWCYLKHVQKRNTNVAELIKLKKKPLSIAKCGQGMRALRARDIIPNFYYLFKIKFHHTISVLWCQCWSTKELATWPMISQDLTSRDINPVVVKHKGNILMRKIHISTIIGSSVKLKQLLVIKNLIQTQKSLQVSYIWVSLLSGLFSD